MARCRVTVAQYGHPALKGAWHYSILVYNQPEAAMATAFQIRGGEGPKKFALAPEEVVTPRRASSFQGELVVGWIPFNDASMTHFRNSTRLVTIMNGEDGWNCQNWVAEVLTQLSKLGLHIQPFKQPELVAAMTNAN